MHILAPRYPPSANSELPYLFVWLQDKRRPFGWKGSEYFVATDRCSPRTKRTNHLFRSQFWRAIIESRKAFYFPSHFRLIVTIWKRPLHRNKIHQYNQIPISCYSVFHLTPPNNSAAWTLSHPHSRTVHPNQTNWKQWNDTLSFFSQRLPIFKRLNTISISPISEKLVAIAYAMSPMQEIVSTTWR